MNNTRKNLGFTLIELVIALGIMAILVSIAVPSYQQQSMRAARTEAIDTILREASEQERQYTMTGAYQAKGNYRTASDKYRIRTFVDNGGQGFRIRAIPLAGQASDDCSWLQINQQGVKRSRVAAQSGECWSGR